MTAQGPDLRWDGTSGARHAAPDRDRVAGVLGAAWAAVSIAAFTLLGITAE